MKTSLPKKVDVLPFEVARNYSIDALEQYYKRDNTLNQLIDVVAELTEVVEGKQWRADAKEYLNQNLKEQLLGEIEEMNQYTFEDGRNYAYLRQSDVYDTINRLIP